MNPKIAFAFVLLAIVHQAQSACLCHFGEGKEICSSSGCRGSPPLVIRPANLPKINLESFSKPRVVCQTIGGGINNPFKPIGDLCSCKQSIVMPAIVPRPVCACSSSSSSSSNSNSNSNSHSHSASGCGGNIYVSGGGSNSGSSGSSGSAADWMTSSGGAYIVDAEQLQGPTSAAVDPVSLALAYKEQNRACGVSEGRLAYGFRKLPVEIVVDKPVREEINEHGLYTCNGQIVELKKISCGKAISVDDEAMEQLEAEAEAEEFENNAQQGSGGIKSLRYGDVGFGIAQVKRNPFREVVGVVEANPQPVEAVRTCQDGYKPGNVIFKNTPLTETYMPGPSVPEDCAESQDYRPYFRYSSGSSSASSSNSNSDCKRCAHSRVFY